MRKIVGAAMIAALLSLFLQAPRTARADVASPAPAPTATANALDKTTDIEGTPVKLRDIAELMATTMALYLPLKGPHPTAVFVSKPQRSMPSSDPNLYYSGSELKDGQPVLTIWASQDLNGVTTIGLMQLVGVLGLLESNNASPALQAIYEKQRAADSALGANAADPFKNRRDMAASLAAIFLAILSSDPTQRIKIPQ